MPTGTNWRFVPLRFRTNEPTEMPNLSHGLAGIAMALAVAGTELDRPDLVDAARSGAEHLVSLGDVSGRRLPGPALPPGASGRTRPGQLRLVPWRGRYVAALRGARRTRRRPDRGRVTGLRGSGVACTASRTSGFPARLRPGFWDNDGRCCGTAGVGDILLDSGDLDFALVLADALVERAVRSEQHAYWQFVEHRNRRPLLPPGVGWMQGAAGIAAYLFRVARVAAS